MTKTVRKIGGILVIVGGIITIFAWVMILGYTIEDNNWAYWQISARLFTTLSVYVLSIVGGILLVKDKSVGGILALIAGIVGLIGLVITLGTLWEPEWTNGYVDLSLTVNFFVDPILMVVGGILGLVVGSES